MAGLGTQSAIERADLVTPRLLVRASRFYPNAPCRPMQAPARHETQVRVIPQGPRDLVMSRSAVRVRSSAPQLRLRNQAFATGGTSPAPKLESAPDSNATAVGDGRESRRHLGKRKWPRRGAPGRSPGRAGRAGSRRDIGALPSGPLWPPSGGAGRPGGPEASRDQIPWWASTDRRVSRILGAVLVFPLARLDQRGQAHIELALA